MKRWDVVISVLAVISLIALIAECRNAYPTEMPKTDRNGMYYVVQYEYSNDTQDLVKSTIVKSGTFGECVKYIQDAGPNIQHNGTHTIYGCERQRVPEGKTEPTSLNERPEVLPEGSVHNLDVGQVAEGIQRQTVPYWSRGNIQRPD